MACSGRQREVEGRPARRLAATWATPCPLAAAAAGLAGGAAAGAAARLLAAAAVGLAVGAAGWTSCLPACSAPLCAYLVWAGGACK